MNWFDNNNKHNSNNINNNNNNNNTLPPSTPPAGIATTTAVTSGGVETMGLSVENLTTELRLSREGKREFVINAECVGKERMEQVELDSMVSKLSDVKSHFGFDMFEIRVHH